MNKRHLWLFFGAVLAVKLAVMWQLKDHPLLHPQAGLDTTAYVNLAGRVLAGDVTLGPGLYFVSPLYIYFLAGTLAIADSFTVVRTVQMVLGTASVAFIFFATRAWFGTRPGWYAALLAAATGLLTFYETLILQASIDAFLTSAALLALAGGLRTAPRTAFATRGLLLAGCLFALGALNRPNMLFGAGAVIAAGALLRRWRPAALLTLGLMAGLAPAVIRNLAVAGEWSVVSSHGGLNLYIGNHANATGFYREVPGIRPLIEGQQGDAREVAGRALGRQVSDGEASRYFTTQAAAWTLQNPLAAARLFARKLFFTFHSQHVALPHSYPFYAYDTGSLLRWLAVGPWLLVPLGIVGLLFGTAAGRRPEFLMWLAFVPGYAVGVATFFVAERYRLPLLVPLSVGAGAAIDIFWRGLRTRRSSALVAPAAVLVLLAVVVNWPLPYVSNGRWEEGLRTAQRLSIVGDYAGAEGWADRLERTGGTSGRAHHGLGMQLVAQNQMERALPQLRKAVERGYAAGDDVEVWLRAGRLSARTESPLAAEPFFRRAAELAPGHAPARQQYGLNLLLLERIPEATRELQQAASLDPRDPDTFAHLAYCEVRLGRHAEARRHVDAALSLAPDHPLARQLSAAISR